MSLANTTQLEILEYRFEQMRLALQQALRDIAALQSQLANAGQGNGNPSGGSGLVFTIAPIVISAGGNATGQTVKALVSGSSTPLPGTYTVYNQMNAPTVSTANKTIIVGGNPDGTFSVITQSC
jgi:hypothetical protein